MPTVPFLGGYGDLSGSGLMFRNKLINGGFDIWQRGTSQTSNGYGSDDRWSNAHSGSSKTTSRQTFTVGQSDVPGNPTYFSRTVVTQAGSPASSDFVIKRQNIENVATLSGQTVTVSMWAKADANRSFSIEFSQSFGTGGSSTASGTGNKFTLTTSWQLITATITLPSISGKTVGADNYLQMNIWLSAGADYNSRTNSLGQQSGTFDISNVQLEAGSVATPFEQRPVGTELSLCQRYYWDIPVNYSYAGYIGGSIASQVGRVQMNFPVPMRATPTQNEVTPTYSVSSGSVTALGFNIRSNFTGEWSIGGTAGFVSISTTGRFSLGAEL